MKRGSMEFRRILTAGLVLSLLTASATCVYGSSPDSARGEKRNSAEIGGIMAVEAEKEAAEKKESPAAADAAKDADAAKEADAANASKESDAANEAGTSKEAAAPAAGTAEKAAEKTTGESAEKAADGSSEETSEPAKPSEAEDTAAQEPEADPEKAQEIKKAEEAFLKFIQGTGTVTYRNDNVFANSIGIFDKLQDGRKYTLKEILDVFQEVTDQLNGISPEKKADIKPVTAEYAFLEDGVQPMMALHIRGELVDESINMYYVMEYNQFSDEISVVYGKDFWSRGYFRVNTAGIVTEYGTVSAFENYYSYFQIGKDGRVRHLYSAAYDNRKAALSEDLNEWLKDVALVSYVIGRDQNDSSMEITEMTDYYTLHDGMGGDYTFSIELDGMFSEENPAYALYKEDSIEISDSMTVIRAILGRFAETGVTMDSFYSGKPQWKPVG